MPRDFKSPSWLLIFIASSLYFAASGHVQAQSVDEFYKGRTMTAIIGFPPGGGYNHYMRLLTRYMPRHIPGNPNIISRNMPAAGSLVAANYIYNTAPKDGSLIGVFAASTLFSKLMGEVKADFDIPKFTWIGNMDKTIGTCAVWHESKIKSFEDLYRQEGMFGASGPGAVNSTHARAFNALLGTRVKVINGYNGSTGTFLAMQRNELDGGCGFALSSLKATRASDWKDGRLKIIIQTGKIKSPELDGVPHLYDMAKSEEDKMVMDLIYGTHILGRPISAPPEISADRKKALRDAFDASMKDPDLLAEAAKLNIPIDAWTGEETERIIAQFASYPQRIVNRAIKVLEVGEVINVKLKTMSGTIDSIDNRSVIITDRTGKRTTVMVHPQQTKLTIAGSTAKTGQLKAGMTCLIEYFGAGDLAPKVSCN